MAEGTAQLALVIFGGPNGSGKSTITNEVRREPDFPKHYINADEIAQRLKKESGRSAETHEQKHDREVRAQAEADKERAELIKRHESFAFETVASHPSKIAIIDHAKKHGYDVALYFVSTNDPQINVARVRERVQQGGHDVDEKKIVERYHRALSLLPAAAERADLTLAFDNSSSDKKAKALLVARVNGGKLEVMADQVPPYYQAKLIDPFTKERPDEIARIHADFSGKRDGVKTADLNAGRYTGPIVAANKHFVVQDHGRSVVVHDRAVLEACKIKPEVGKTMTLEYRGGNVKTLERGAERGRA